MISSLLDVITEKIKPKDLFKLDRALLEAVVLRTVDHDWTEAQKYIEKGNLERCKKTLIRTLLLMRLGRAATVSDFALPDMFRVVILFTQIARDGAISNYQAPIANETVTALRGAYAKDWATYRGLCEDPRDAVLAELHTACAEE